MSLPEAAGRSLRGRLAGAIGGGALLVLSVSFVALHLLIRDELYRALDEDLRDRMHAVAEYVAAHRGREDAAEFMPQFRARSHREYFQIWDAHGASLVHSDSSAGRDMPRPDAVAGRPTYHEMTLPDGHRGRAVAQVFELPPDDPRGEMTVVTAAEIENLEATGLLEEARYREYVFGLSLIFRRYLEGRFHVPAAEQTTEEILASLRRAKNFDKALKEATRSFLEETDPVKYRGLEPRPAETETWRSRLLSFMERASETKDIQEAA